MTAIIAALLPIFLLISTGYVLKLKKFPGDDIWGPLERLVYFLLFPALLGSNLAKADLEGFEVLPLAGVIIAALAIMGFVTIGLKQRFGQGPAVTSAFQGTVRFNSYVGLAICADLWGAAGNALGAVVVAIMVPMSNALCVFALARFSGVHPPGAKAVLGMMLKNPLIIACLAGFVLNYTGIGMPPVVGPVIEILAQAALPIGILCVGAGLDLSVLRSAGRRVIEASLLRLFGMPLLMWALCLLFGVSGLTAKVVILMGALPTASSSFILARQMGGDVALMAGIITVSTLTAMVTMPVLLPILW